MSTVTYKNQPAIERSKGRVPLAGTSHLYRVKRILWPQAVQSVLRDLLIPTSLHVCSGHSLLGDIRVDADKFVFPDVVCDAARLPFGDQSFNSVLCDPPYNGRFQWNHDMLSELSRVARSRIIFQHWFIPADRHGRWRKFHKFRTVAVYAWQPKTYFGRAQIITVFDVLDEDTSKDPAFAASPAAMALQCREAPGSQPVSVALQKAQTTEVSVCRELPDGQLHLNAGSDRSL